MRFSVIIPSFLGQYRTAAANRDRKILRAIQSVLDQSFKDFEIIVVADGCKLTPQIVNPILNLHGKCVYIDKSKLWSGVPRQTGIDEAQGDYIIYLDIDDLWGPDHLANVNEGLKDYDWVWFDDIRFEPKTGQWYQNPCDINKMGSHGTSNICHKRNLNVKWNYNGYAHDHYFIRNLRKFKNFTKIEGGEYYVCHIPPSTIGKGYDK